MGRTLDALLLQLVKWFVERQLIKWGKEIDWEKVKVDAESRIAAVVPGEQFDDVSRYLVGTLIDILSAYFREPALCKLTDQYPTVEQKVTFAMGQANQQFIRKLGEKAIEKK